FNFGRLGFLSELRNKADSVGYSSSFTENVILLKVLATTISNSKCPQVRRNYKQTSLTMQAEITRSKHRLLNTFWRLCASAQRSLLLACW
ncbi:hypothetical protein, partial [Vibrio parahaemolyticus]